MAFLNQCINLSVSRNSTVNYIGEHQNLFTISPEDRENQDYGAEINKFIRTIKSSRVLSSDDINLIVETIELKREKIKECLMQDSDYSTLVRSDLPYIIRVSSSYSTH